LTNEKFGAEVSKIDFTNSEAAGGIINYWVSKKTDGFINGIISPDMITEFSLMTLVTAILFKGKWAEKFQHAGKGVFWSLAGKTEEVEVHPNFMRLDSSKSKVLSSKVLNHTVSHHALSDWLTDVVRSPPPTAS